MSDVPKKKKILEYLLETRRQMIKMLVLVKWAKVSKEVEQCIVHPLVGPTDFRMSFISSMDSGIASTTS
jgi:hypothetical protein